MRTSHTSRRSSCRWRGARAEQRRIHASNLERIAATEGSLAADRRAGVIQHVTLEVRREDAPAEARFWELLGFAGSSRRPAWRERSLWLEREGTQVHLALRAARR